MTLLFFIGWTIFVFFGGMVAITMIYEYLWGPLFAQRIHELDEKGLWKRDSDSPDDNSNL